MGFHKSGAQIWVKQTPLPLAYLREPMPPCVILRSSSTSIQWTSTALHFYNDPPHCFHRYPQTLSLTQIACAVAQACHYPISPESSTPAVTIPRYYTAKYDPKYENANGDVGGTACSDLAKRFPKSQNVPFFPDIGRVCNTTNNSSHCGAIWKLTNIANNKSTNIITIDNTIAAFEFGLSSKAFIELSGVSGGKSLTVSPEIVGHL